MTSARPWVLPPCVGSEASPTACTRSTLIVGAYVRTPCTAATPPTAKVPYGSSRRGLPTPPGPAVGPCTTARVRSAVLKRS
jgi:hypothetical protein